MDEEIIEEGLRREAAPGRKVVQICAMVHPDKDWAFIALCDDGSLPLDHGSWSRIESIPLATSVEPRASVNRIGELMPKGFRH
jgi:hypothetical protein